MRGHRVAFSHSRTFALSLIFLSAVLTSACSRILASYDVAPNGLLRSDDELRRLLARGQPDSALQRLISPKKKNSLPNDELLRLLYEGITAQYAGDYQRSAAAFDLATLVADDRTTKSLSKAALSVMVSELSLAYEPSRTERLLIPYYAALTYLRSGAYNDAAVEARRLSVLLQRLADNGDAPEPRLHAFLRYFAGVVFETAGDFADADVAYRNAFALDSTRLPRRTARAPRTGEVVVLAEAGFAPHRVQESLILALNDDDSHEFDDDDEERRRRAADRLSMRVLAFAGTNGPRTGEPRSRTLWIPAPAATASSERKTVHCDSVAAQKAELPAQTVADTASARAATVPGSVSAPPARQQSVTRNCSEREHEDHSYILRMSWPVMYAPMNPVPQLDLLLDATAFDFQAYAHVSEGVLADFQREQSLILARTIARAAAKYALTRAAEKKADKKDETLGAIVGVIANIGGVLSEQADTRSWHLLPRSIGMLRVPLPAGTHRLRVRGGSGQPVDIGEVTVRPGAVTVVSTRMW